MPDDVIVRESPKSEWCDHIESHSAYHCLFELSILSLVTDSKSASPAPIKTLNGREPPRKRHPIRRFLIVCLVCYVGLVTLVAVFQRSLMYVPFRADISRSDAGPLSHRTTHATVAAGDGITLNGWRVRPKGERRRTILYFPGNAANRINRVSTLDILSEDGAEVFLFDYRGYGDNEGSPSEEAIAADARSLWNWLTTDQKIPPEEIIIYGQSLGGGVAVRLVADLADEGISPRGLILVATFSSMVDAAKNHYGWVPIDWLLMDRYPSESRVPNITCPIVQLHGDRDRIVPMRLGEKLFERVPADSESGVPKKFVQLPRAGHNDILYAAQGEYRAGISKFLARLK